MNKNFGGKQRHVRDSEIKQEQGYLQKRDDIILNPGNTQSVIFKDDSKGLFYLSTSERVARKFDKPTEKNAERKYIKAELLQLLHDKGHLMSPGTNVKILQNDVRNRVYH